MLKRNLSSILLLSLLILGGCSVGNIKPSYKACKTSEASTSTNSVVIDQKEIPVDAFFYKTAPKLIKEEFQCLLEQDLLTLARNKTVNPRGLAMYVEDSSTLMILVKDTVADILTSALFISLEHKTGKFVTIARSLPLAGSIGILLGRNELAFDLGSYRARMSQEEFNTLLAALYKDAKLSKTK